MTCSRRTFLKTSAAATAFAAFPGGLPAQDFSGKTITFWVPYREGGGTDTWARFLSNWMPRYIEGAPTVIVRNVTGGGAIGGGNEFFRRAATDGTDILGTAGGLQLPFLLGDKQVEYDYATWFPAFASPFGGVVYMRSEDAPDSPAALLDAGTLNFGSFGAAGSDLIPLLAFEILGVDTQVTFGFSGRGDQRLSILRGELDIDYQTTSSYLSGVQPLIDDGTMTALFAWGVLDDEGDVQRDPTFPDLPSFPEYYESVHGSRPSGAAWEAWKAAYAAAFAYQKFVVMPDAVPQDVRSALRGAMADMAADPAFREEAAAALGAYDQISGEALDEAVDRATSMPDDAKRWVLDWLRETYDVSL